MVRASVLCGAVLFPPKVRVATSWPPSPSGDATSTFAVGSPSSGLTSLRRAATYPRASLTKFPPRYDVSDAMTPPLRAPGAGGGQGECAHVGWLLRDPVPVEAQRDGVHGRQLPVEAQQAERIVAGAVVGAGQHGGHARGAGESAKA